jgi:hypothetical protein
MKINGKETIIATYTSEILGDEMVLYCEKSHKIVVLNQIATLIWNSLLEGHKSNKNVYTEDIANMIMTICNLPNSEMNTVSGDIDEAIESLYESSLLVLRENSEEARI